MHHEEHILMGALDGERRIPRRWLSFASGLSVGLVSSLVGVGLAVAWERARRGQRRGGLAAPLTEGAADSRAPTVHPPTLTAAALEQRELDEELSQTFPASDPLPQSHRVD